MPYDQPEQKPREERASRTDNGSQPAGQQSMAPWSTPRLLLLGASATAVGVKALNAAESSLLGSTSF